MLLQKRVTDRYQNCKYMSAHQANAEDIFRKLNFPFERTYSIISLWSLVNTFIITIHVSQVRQFSVIFLSSCINQDA